MPRPSVPLEYDVAGRTALVVGAEAIVAGKIDRLLDAGAEIHVWSAGLPIAEEVAATAASGRVKIGPGEPPEESLARAVLVYVTPGVAHALCERLFIWALRSGRLLNAIDRPELSTFASPAATTVSGLGLRVFSFGQSPGLSRRLREELERALSDPRLERFVAELARLRAELPRGQRAEPMRRALEGFSLRVELRFPEWLSGEKR